MRRAVFGCLVALTLLIAGCGKPDARVAPLASGTPSDSLLPPAAAPPASSAPQTLHTPPGKITRLNEDGTESVEDSAADSPSHNPLLAAVAASVGSATSAAAAAPVSGTSAWQAGVNYTQVVPAQPTSVAAGQVEVLEFFWYACPHCYALDPLVESWARSKPAYITFTRVPTEWNDGHRALARLFYTVRDLGKLDELHTLIFKEIRDNNDPLIGLLPGDDGDSERVQLAFVAKHGVPQAAFEEKYHSFSVDRAMQQADQLAQRYRVSAVPTFVVNGKYVADVGSAGGQERLMALISDLAAGEHRR